MHYDLVSMAVFQHTLLYGTLPHEEQEDMFTQKWDSLISLNNTLETKPLCISVDDTIMYTCVCIHCM